MSEVEPSGGMRSAQATPGVHGQLSGTRVSPVGARAAVSAGHPLVARVAQQVLDAGGTAVDAGVAGCLSACVVQVDMCNLGGIAPALVRVAGDDAVHAIDGVGAWSAGADLDAHLACHGDDLPLGAASAVVPGAVHALLTALERFGTWSFEAVVAGALEQARAGVLLDARTARSLRLLGAVYSRWPSTTAILWPSGAPPRAGERVRQSALARLMERLVAAERSAAPAGRSAGIDAARRAFYTGPVAERIAAQVRSGGGVMTLADLAGHACEVSPATRSRCFGWDVHVPGFHSQAPTLLQALLVLERTGVGEDPAGADRLHLLAEAFKLAFADREAFYGDPRHVRVDAEHLLSAAHADALAALVDPRHARPYTHVRLAADSVPASATARRDTTYVACVDAAGNAFSASPSDTIDGAPLDEELGILISPRGVQSKLVAGHPAALGGGRRPRLTPSPALAVRRSAAAGEEPELLAFGCPGGDVIVQAMAHVFIALVHDGSDAQEAVEAPRSACFDAPASFFPFPHARRRLAVEGRIAASVRAELAARGHEVTVWPDWEFDAGAVAVAMDLRPPRPGDRALVAAADPRRSGVALAW